MKVTPEVQQKLAHRTFDEEHVLELRTDSDELIRAYLCTSEPGLLVLKQDPDTGIWAADQDTLKAMTTVAYALFCLVAGQDPTETGKKVTIQ